jgi:hypothetical protein
MCPKKNSQAKHDDELPKQVIVNIECQEFYSYSLAFAIPTPLQSVLLLNNTDRKVEGLRIEIDSATDLLTDSTFEIGDVAPGKGIEIDCSGVRVDLERLLQLTESTIDHLAIRFFENDKLMHEEVHEITFFTFDQWTGAPETLAAFITPNHPAIAPVIVKASQYLGEWTGSSAFTGYQTGDPKRARMQAAAIFRAIQEQGIVYVGAPATFGPGQRIRMPDMVLEQHMATCLDFSILYAACLEAIELRPLIIMIRGHAFNGVWLEEQSFPELLVDDLAALTKRIAKGVDSIALVQSVDMAVDADKKFEDAEKTGRMLVEQEFHCALDVRRARAAGFLPLPVRIKGDAGWTVEAPEVNLSAATAPKSREVSTAYLDVTDEHKTKKQLWERSLLDLSMNNSLLNMRYGRRAMPIFVPSIDEVEDTLALANDLVIAPKPSEFPNIDPKEAFNVLGLGEFGADLLYDDFKSGRLRTAFTESELKKNLDNLYRSARSSLEETGANTLFLTMGTLSWIDEKRGGQVRHAPIMLFPIDIIRKSAKTGYIIRLRDEEPQINISLIEMLRADFDIRIDGLDPLPLDEAGVDTRLVLNTFVQKVIDQPGWEVIEAATIGLFSFSQFVMWNDIRAHEDELRKSKIVDSMLEGHLTWTPGPFNPDEVVDPSELLLPIEADASQLFAIKAALGDNSFVLHGPPGTGKSQTITAIIANALARGKKVLFVAEKMAALEVVEKRLANLGLEQFCLEVHSTKATKNHVLEQIQTACEMSTSAKKPGYEQKRNEILALRSKLDTYAEGLARRNTAGLTLREMICEYERLSEFASPMDIDPSFIDGIANAEDFKHKLNAAERILAMAGPLAPLSSHPLKMVEGSSYSESFRLELPAILARYRSTLDELESQSQSLAGMLGRTAPRSIAEHRQLESIANQLLGQRGIPSAWLANEDPKSLVKQVRKLIELAKEAEARRAKLLAQHHPSMLDLDIPALKAEWLEANSKGLIGRNRAIAKVVAKVALCSLSPITAESMGPLVRELEDFHAAKRSFATAIEDARAYLDGLVQMDGSYDWASIERLADRLEQISGKAGEIPGLPDGTPSEELLELCGDYSDALAACLDERGRLESALGITSPDDAEPFIEGERALADALEDNLSMLKEWMAWRSSVETARDLGLSPLLDALETLEAGNELLDEFKCGVYRMMCMQTLDGLEGMSDFSTSRFNETVRQYARADEELRELAKKQIYYEVASRLPNLTLESVVSPEAAQLQKALRSRGRNVSIRSVLSETGDVVRSLCPCFLMSPLSVAQYLEPGEQFDLLIFDEASQLQTCKAIGALARAKNAIIVGDPRQMPPTSFFQGKVTGEDYEEVSDLESVLEDALALNMPQTYLRWHYRSRHESLIAFSNRRFYEGKMFTFPSADDRRSCVEFVKVDGYFDRGGSRVNKAEAEAIVAELVSRAADPKLSGESVGVVTFNIPQQVLIQDLFQDACAKDPELEKWATEGVEPLFIKNLENVQGDERDVVLFSITYAPDKNGNMSMNFGPINREGGWRRLNVAVTRARLAMKVFSSMESTDIDTNRVSSMGPVAFQAFLAYAQRGAGSWQAPSVQPDGAYEDTIADELCKHLAERGYKTRRNVGQSRFKVDIGIIDPYDESGYLAAVMLDGSTYEMAKTTRDREIAQPRILRGLGWNAYRVWALEWWENSTAVVEALVQFLKGVEQDKYPDGPPEIIQPEPEREVEPEPEPAPEPEPEPEPELEPEPEAEPEPEPVPTPAPEPELEPEPAPEPEPVAAAPAVHREPYQVAALDLQPISADEFLNLDDRELAATMDAVIEVEAPIELSMLVRRVTQAYGISRSGTRIQAKCEKALRYAKSTKANQSGRTIIWAKGQDPKAYLVYRPADPDDTSKRPADSIALEEIAAAAYDVVLNIGPMTQDDLVKATSVALGYRRTANIINDFMKRGISLATRRSLLVREGNIYKLADGVVAPPLFAVNTENEPPVAPTKLAESAPVPTGDLAFLIDTMRAFMADGVISLDEAATLKLWLMAHRHLEDATTYDRVFALLDSVLADGQISDEENEELLKLFGEIVGA